MEDQAATIQPLVCYICLALSVAYFGVRKRWSPAESFLGGVKFFRLLTEKDGTAIPEDTSNRSRKKMQQQLQRLMQERRVCAQELDQLLGAFEFYDDFNIVVIFATCVVINVAVAAGISYVLEAQPYHFIFHVLNLCLIGLIAIGIQLEWMHQTISKQDKLFMVLFGLLGAAVTYCCLMLSPPGLLAFDAQAAAAAVLKAWTHLVESRVHKELKFPGDPDAAISGLLVTLPLMLLAAFISAILLAPGIRYGRLLQQMLHPPLWALRYVEADVTAGHKVLAALGLAMPVLMTPLWVTPMIGVLLIPPAWLPTLRLAAVIATVALNVAVLRPLVQTFLYTGFYNWYMLAHMHPKDINEEQRQALMQRSMVLVSRQAIKVALQMALMPAFLTLCGCIMLLKCFPRAGDEAGKQELPLHETVSGYMAWWTSVCWSMYASLGVLFYRAQHQGLKD